VQVAVEFDDSFETESGATMGWSTVLESIDVVLNCVDWDIPEFGSFNQHFWVVDSLSSTGDFFTSHEEIVRVCVIWIVWVQHGVEWSDRRWITIEHVEISTVLLFDNCTKSSLSFGRKIVQCSLFITSFLKQLDTISEMELDNWSFTNERLKWVLGTDDFQLLCVSFFNTFEKIGEHVGQHIKYFEIMLLNGHFHIETCELAQMSVGVGIFSSEDWSNLEDTIKITTESHLLIELWTLSKTSGLVEIFECEYVGASLRCTTDHFWGMNLNEIVFHHKFSIKSADSGLESKDGLVCWDT